MSWSNYPPPPRGRSRSRSPSRTGYPPRGFTDPSDPYRADWEAWDRERAWAMYDRERYDFHRERSRSPDITGRKRRRSPSPYDSRYDPRPRYDEYASYYSHSPPRRGGGGGRRAPPDPYTMDYPASLKQFADWFRHTFPKQAAEEDAADKSAEQEAGDGSKPRNGLKTKWEQYKKEFASKQLQVMFDHHRKSPWFAEKYEPSKKYQDLRARVRKEGWKGRIDQFLDELEMGKLDPAYDDPDPTTAPDAVSSDAQKDETNGSKAEDAKEENKEDTETLAMDVEDDTADANSKTGDKNTQKATEVTVEPEGNQIMIRTIPPDIGRVKLEGVIRDVPGFVYLALGDPMQKRNFYRAGWLKFDESSDMSSVVAELSEKKIEGFKLHVTLNNRPFTNRIRYAPEVASKPERIEKDLANAKALVSLFEEQARTLRRQKFRRAEPPAVIIEGDDKSKPEEVPAPPETVFVEDVLVEDEEDDEPDPKDNPSESIERRVEKLMADLVGSGQVDQHDDKAYFEKKNMITLDLYIAYLRVAFNTCYYCVIVTDHLEELQRKCLKHQRKPLSPATMDDIKATENTMKDENANDENIVEDTPGTEESSKKDEANDGMEVDTKDKKEDDPMSTGLIPRKPVGRGRDRFDRRNDERWLEWLDSKLALLLNRDGVDPRDYGGKHPDEELTKSVQPYVKQEDEGKFRCKTCTKLFKAMSFIEKHVSNKHPELVKGLEDIPYFNNFALDPHHIQPLNHPPTSSQGGRDPYGHGHSQRYDDYSRGYSGYGGYYAYWDYYGYSGYPPPARDSRESGRRLSERITGYADGFSSKPNLDGPLQAGNEPRARRGGRSSMSQPGPPLPPPADAKEDPRASSGRRVSYHDMDSVAEGDVELSY